jgi:hypothetical protein
MQFWCNTHAFYPLGAGLRMQPMLTNQLALERLPARTSDARQGRGCKSDWERHLLKIKVVPIAIALGLLLVGFFVIVAALNTAQPMPILGVGLYIVIAGCCRLFDNLKEILFGRSG